MNDAIEACRVQPGKAAGLNKRNPSSDIGMADKKEAGKATAKNLEAMADWQYRLYAEGKQSLLVVLQGIDAAGKDGTIRKVFSSFDPQGCHVCSFKAPTKEELSHDFLWRVHKETPPHGGIGLFNRSHYEDVLIVRVCNLAPKKVWMARYEQINQFEALLHASGTRILKFFLHISHDEQKKRFQERLDDPAKQWKFRPEDVEQRKHWDKYIEAFEAALTKCSTPDAPWHVIPADRKWYRNWLISEITRRTLEDMNPQIPPPAPGLDQYKL